MNNATTPAFPIWTSDMPVEGAPGLTKREYFAARAMQGILAAGIQKPNEGVDTANWAVHNADAMLAELAK